MSHINEYYQTIWTDTVIKINFSPEQITEGYHIDSIINIGHQGTGNVFFRWKLVVDDVISYHGLNTATKTSINNQYTYANFCLEINDNNNFGIKCISNKTILLQQTDKFINHKLVLQIKHEGSVNFRTCFNTSFSSTNTSKNGYVVSSVTLYEIKQLKLTAYGEFQVLYKHLTYCCILSLIFLYLISFLIFMY